MSGEKIIYLFASFAAAAVFGALIVGLVFGDYTFVLVCVFIVVVLMESRVQLVSRLPRTSIFWIHLSSAVAFFFVLLVLVFFTQTFWLKLLADGIGTVMLYAGAILWYRGVRNTLMSQRTLVS